jgi:2-C-methyl-D-erythritol 4-phosphate cytidylyltransferase
MNYVVVLAGGTGARFGNSSVLKQFVKLTDVPMLVYSLKTAQHNKHVDKICVVSAAAEQAKIRAWGAKYDISKLEYFALSGKERHDSVFAGLLAIPARPRDTVMIMTAVCPFVSQKTMDNLYEKIKTNEAAITVVKATDAITFSNDGKNVNRTLQKKKLYIQQGPQIFRYRILQTAHKVYNADPDMNKIEVSEDSELVLNIGAEVAMVLGDRFCIKVTYPEDLAIAKSLHKLFVEQERKYAESCAQ